MTNQSSSFLSVQDARTAIQGVSSGPQWVNVRRIGALCLLSVSQVVMCVVRGNKNKIMIIIILITIVTFFLFFGKYYLVL